MAGDHDEELTAEPTEGFKVGEKKTIDEYQQLGACHCCLPSFPFAIPASVTAKARTWLIFFRPERRVPPQVERVARPGLWQGHLRPQ